MTDTIQLSILLSWIISACNQQLEYLRGKSRLWRERNPNRVQEHNIIYRERRNELAHRHYRANRAACITRSLQAYRRNPKLANVKRWVRAKKQILTNPSFRIGRHIRAEIWACLRGKKKHLPSLELLGCTLQELKVHLESLFKTGMSWGNYGRFGWHIDHKIPSSRFDLSDPEQQRKCFHYSNLQPLWANDNLTKGNKYALL